VLCLGCVVCCCVVSDGLTPVRLCVRFVPNPCVLCCHGACCALQSSGFGDFLYGLFSTLSIVAIMIGYRFPLLAAIAGCCMFLGLCAWTGMRLPFYHAYLNSILSSAYAITAALFFTTIFVVTIGSDGVSIGLLIAMTIPAGIGGASLPLHQWRRMQRCVCGLCGCIVLVLLLVPLLFVVPLPPLHKRCRYDHLCQRAVCCGGVVSPRAL